MFEFVFDASLFAFAYATPPFVFESMQERAKTIGAAISFRSAPDDGMQIKLGVEI